MRRVRRLSRAGRRPLLAAGNSNGEIDMLAFTQHPGKPYLRLLVEHDDGMREFDYVAGSAQALKEPETQGWTVVGMRDDWLTVF
ncbi:hypothetical protein Acy02nite_74160 [Actinoplanes cyaneus]|uniref:Uncharacterized protein n=1 Tax=Actinoplanes cyaneus TaxID=52696 RepID=A0A919IWU3_9ACTN|nr:hypothetical protein [Actinoplanes cyaneus]MCW2143028.1 hypothetical protein [Actinoplanes cyaneus]GID69535.1 hypothetical protein Acy02nite_74160 [Actinoplanes cyaneus]